jgi:hypothetical protein
LEEALWRHRNTPVLIHTPDQCDATMGYITMTVALGPGLFETFTGDLSTKKKKVVVELPRTVGCLRARAASSLFPAEAEMDLIVADK